MIEYSDNAYSRVTTLDAYSMPVHMYKGVANMKLNRYRLALKDFHIALKHFPTQISILNNLGTVSSILGEDENAEKYFTQATELFPQYEVGWLNLAKTYFKDKEYEKAYIALLKYHTKNKRADFKKLKMRLESLINNTTI
jgi:tetratricopeptide (TPR) repeat protein